MALHLDFPKADAFRTTSPLVPDSSDAIFCNADNHAAVWISTMAIGLFIVSISIYTLYARGVLRQRDPFSPKWNLPKSVPNPDFLLGHYGYTACGPDTVEHDFMFRRHANNLGITAFWFLWTPGASVTLARHARIILRSSVTRKNFSILSRHAMRIMGTYSLVFMEGGHQWRLHRNLVQKAFTAKAVAKLASKVWKVANTFSNSLVRASEKEGGVYKCDALEIFNWATLDIFGLVGLGVDYECTKKLRMAPVTKALDQTIEDVCVRTDPRNVLNPFTQLYGLPTKRNRIYHENINLVKNLLCEICDQRKCDIAEAKEQANAEKSESLPSKKFYESPGSLSSSISSDTSSASSTASSVVSVHETDDLLSLLIKSHTKTNEGEEMSSEDLTEMLLTLFFAGYETSSVALSYAFALLSCRKDVQDECAREAYAATHPSDPLEQNIDEDPDQWENLLTYCKGVVLETLRLHPPVYFNARSITKDTDLDGHIIPKGTRVLLPITIIHTDERNFFRAKEFIPERWVRKDESTGKWTERDHLKEPADGNDKYIPPANPHHLFSFSDGARNCLGRRLALQEMTMLLACLVRDLEVETPPDYVLQKRKKFLTAPPAALSLKFTKRSM